MKAIKTNKNGVEGMAAGDIYLIRDLDLRTGAEIDYLKIGRTKPNESDERISKHQTGNPRLITKKWDGVVPNDAAIEGHLHHYFSSDRIRGEWFWIDDNKLTTEVIPLLNTLITEYTAHEANLAVRKTLKETDDNGVSRLPNSVEAPLAADLQQAMNDLEVARKQHGVHDLNLRTMMASDGGIDGVVKITSVSGRDSFDKSGFLASLTTAQQEQCHHPTKTSRIASPKWHIKPEKLSVLDPSLNTEHSTAKAAAPTGTPPTSQLTALPGVRTTAIEAEHQSWLDTRRAVKVLEWVIEQLKSQLLVSLGSDLEIQDVVSWPRYEQIDTNVWDKSLAKTNFEAEVASFTTAGNNGTKVLISRGRGYP